jgi:hypothetical protein
MLHTRDLSGTVEVDGLQYEWAVQREPQWCTVDGWRGMTVMLRCRDAQREAILEFPMPPLRGRHLHRPEVNRRVVENGVRAALAAGWDPASRGKAVVFEVDANGS